MEIITMLTTAVALLSVTTFAATVFHLNSEAAQKEISTSELWKIRAYQEFDTNRR